MKTIIIILLSLTISSCSIYNGKLNNISNKIEEKSKIEYILKSKKSNSTDIARERNIKLRLETFLKHKKEILNNRKESFYLIESYDYDLGYVFLNYLIIDENVYTYLKDDFLLKLDRDMTVPNKYIVFIKNKLDNKQIQYLESLSIFRENANCNEIYYVHEIDKKDLRLLNSIRVVCFDEDENP